MDVAEDSPTSGTHIFGRNRSVQSSGSPIDSAGYLVERSRAIAGKSKGEIIAANKQAYDEKQLPPLEAGSMSYMMSKQAYLTAKGGNLAHVMVHPARGSGDVGQ